MENDLERAMIQVPGGNLEETTPGGRNSKGSEIH